MPHGPGYTLGRIQVELLCVDTNEIVMNVFYYDFGVTSATVANADACAAGVSAYYSANAPGLYATNVQGLVVNVVLDDGTTQAIGGSYMTWTGSAGAVSLSQVMTAIIRKRAVGSGRRRFGHTCHGPVSEALVDDPNTLSAGTVTSLNAFYAGVNDGLVFTTLLGGVHGIYHADLDTISPVYYFVADPDLKTQRHRTPGRGI